MFFANIASIAFFIWCIFAFTVQITQSRALNSDNQQDDSITVDAQNSITKNPVSEDNNFATDFEIDPTTIAGLFEGDIAGMNDSEIMLRNVVLGQKVWPNGQIPYDIDWPFNLLEKLIINAAMAEFHAKSCVRFVPWNNEPDYAKIVKGKGCSSDVGRKGGAQKITLGDGCVVKGIVMHELLHAAGFWHEQSREDRDSYVDILWDNIKPENIHNFNKYSWSTTQSLDEQYDTGSLMHYGERSFAKNPTKPTIRSKSLFAPKMGQRKGFSQIDLNKLNKLYSCNTARKAKDDHAN